jgi:predicted component of type VI protein secretion system
MTGLGREQITIGSAPNCDVVLQAPGVAPLHARIVKQPIGLALVDLGAGATFANGAPIAPNTLVPFDFRTVFAVGQTNVPLAHPAIVSMLMAQGQRRAWP